MSKLSFPPCYSKLTKTANQAIASGVEEVVDWNVVSNVGNILGSATNNWIEIAQSGLYVVRASVWWDGEVTPAASSYRYLLITRNPVANTGFVTIRTPSTI